MVFWSAAFRLRSLPDAIVAEEEDAGEEEDERGVGEGKEDIVWDTLDAIGFSTALGSSVVVLAEEEQEKEEGEEGWGEEEAEAAAAPKEQGWEEETEAEAAPEEQGGE